MPETFAEDFWRRSRGLRSPAFGPPPKRLTTVVTTARKAPGPRSARWSQAVTCRAYRLKEGRRLRVRRVHMSAENNNRNVMRAGQLERGGHRLSAAARNPGVVDNQDVGAGNRIPHAHPAGINASSMDLPLRDSQPHERQRDT